MYINEAWPGIYNEGYIHQFQSETTHHILPWNTSQMITQMVPISARIVITCETKSGIPLTTWKKNRKDRLWDQETPILETYFETLTEDSCHDKWHPWILEIYALPERAVGNIRTSIPDMALKLPRYFCLLMERPLGRYFKVWSSYCQATQCKHLYPEGDRSGVRIPKKDKHQHWSRLPPAFITLCWSKLICWFRFSFQWSM